MAPRVTVTAPRTRVPAFLLVAAMGLFAAASCADAGPPVTLGLCQPVDPAVGFRARDSASVRVVENLSSAEDLSLHLADEPTAVIGARDDDPDDVIGRLAGADRLLTAARNELSVETVQVLALR